MRHRFVFDSASVCPRIALRASYLCAFALWACRSAGGDAANREQDATLARGDHVVVEPRAAEFFEGRVLSIGKSQLRIEPVGKHEGISVSISDVYPLNRPPINARQGQWAICHLGDVWLGCRVERVREGSLEVQTVKGDPGLLPVNQVLAASPATELNLRRAFAKAATTAAFAKEAAMAGRPAAPAGFRVTRRARVVAYRAGGWFSGVVTDVREHAVHVSFAPDNVSEPIAASDIVPEPPASNAPSRGELALIRPPSPAEPWQVMRVVGLEHRDFKVAGADAQPRQVTARDVLPLTPSPPRDAPQNR
jgi:hypothetical protein